MAEMDVTAEDFARVEEILNAINVRSQRDYYLRKYNEDYIILPYTVQIYSFLLASAKLMNVWLGEFPLQYEAWGFSTGFSLRILGVRVVIVCP